VAEETGVVGELGPELGTLRYTDNRGRPKTVRYWALRTGRDPSTWKPGDEVDELRWLDPDGARVALTYRRDGEVLKAFLDRVAAAPPA
jgi:8-oxo-dGTP pyrophosphatase MutT (NUDIX family)